MKIKIFQLDWRADDATIAKQQAQINAFLAKVTLFNVIAVDEYFMAFYIATIPKTSSKVSIYKMTDEVSKKGQPSVESELESFLSGKTVISVKSLDSGTMLIVYE